MYNHNIPLRIIQIFLFFWFSDFWLTCVSLVMTGSILLVACFRTQFMRSVSLLTICLCFSRLFVLNVQFPCVFYGLVGYGADASTRSLVVAGSLVRCTEGSAAHCFLLRTAMGAHAFMASTLAWSVPLLLDAGYRGTLAALPSPPTSPRTCGTGRRLPGGSRSSYSTWQPWSLASCTLITWPSLHFRFRAAKLQFEVAWLPRWQWIICFLFTRISQRTRM